ncbi:MAG: PIN domain-containing protein [Candidatus Sabulitectum sp.]|nr:PIN domain-containing protein [Candidatus Sabulitectum sp.]
MRILVDTCIWSLALRPPEHNAFSTAIELRNLVADNRVEIIGSIRQELLSGIRENARFTKIRNRLAAFPDVPVVTEDYVTAARFCNQCSANGIHGSNTDFLICAISIRNQFAIYTKNKDFSNFAKHIPISLHKEESL